MATMRTTRRKQQPAGASKSATADQFGLNYLVSQSDPHYAFDFGGTTCAAFSAKGDAYTYAREIFGRNQIATRVWAKRTRRTEFMFGEAAGEATTEH